MEPSETKSPLQEDGDTDKNAASDDKDFTGEVGGNDDQRGGDASDAPAVLNEESKDKSHITLEPTIQATAQKCTGEDRGDGQPKEPPAGVNCGTLSDKTVDAPVKEESELAIGTTDVDTILKIRGGDASDSPAVLNEESEDKSPVPPEPTIETTSQECTGEDRGDGQPKEALAEVPFETSGKIVNAPVKKESEDMSSITSELAIGITSGFTIGITDVDTTSKIRGGEASDAPALLNEESKDKSHVTLEPTIQATAKVGEDRGDGQVKEPPVEVHCDTNLGTLSDKVVDAPVKKESELTIGTTDVDTISKIREGEASGAPALLNEESKDKSQVTLEPTIQATAQECTGEDRDDGQPMEPPAEVPFDVESKKTADAAANEGSEDKSRVAPEPTTETSAQGDEGNSESAMKNQKPSSQEALASKQTKKDAEPIGPTPHVDSDVSPHLEENKGRNFWIGAASLVALAVAVTLPFLQAKNQHQTTDLRPIDIFHQEMEKLKFEFPNQREELWKRSRIHLQRHFEISQPTEPVSIILTAGVRGEGTLHCLAQGIASALSSAVNASALYLDGASKSSQDSDLVKSDIDSQLQKAFEGGKPIAVIHRFEELPPASTLIFYRYCDHENAAFKKTFLIFTVLLGEEEEIRAKIHLSEVEEMVTDHLQKKFLSHDHPTAFDKMDIDKYGGLWSRISHLILPVATEKRIETTQQC